MLILAVAALLAAQDYERSTAGPAALPVQTLHTPDEIAPAVLPYLACLYATRGLPLLRGTDGQPISGGTPGPGNDCSAVRGHARDDALKLLQGKPMPSAGSPETFVENTLLEMDSYVATLSPPRTRATGDMPVVESVPVTIEDEVQPAYTKYYECLRDKVKTLPLNAANVLPKFNDAIAACRDIRASSVKEATQALVKKGWGEEARQKAAENSFAKADESWNTMAQRLHDALLRRTANRDSATPPKKPQ